MKALFLTLALAGPLAAAAQTAPPAFTSTCRDVSGDGSQARFCETRDLTMPAPAGQTLTIDGSPNGGVAVKGWDGTDVRIRATIQVWGGSQEQAQTQAHNVKITAAGTTLQANGGGHTSVSFEVFVPRRMALAVTTLNGGISLSGLQGTVSFRTQNGGVSLADLGGQVTGKTANGGLSIRLSGRQWQGEGLDVSTANGGITWHLPAGYSAQFFTSTSGGSIETTLPTSKPQGRYREVKTTLGAGGQPVKAVTTNGGITIEQG